MTAQLRIYGISSIIGEAQLKKAKNIENKNNDSNGGP